MRENKKLTKKIHKKRRKEKQTRSFYLKGTEKKALKERSIKREKKHYDKFSCEERRLI